MKQEPNKINDVDEVLRKIGRNMMLYQQMEHSLKFLIANGKLSGFVSELKELRIKRAESINKQTMGQLVGQYIDTNNPNYEEELDEPDVMSEAYISFRFRTECDSVYYETKKELLAKIVFERNELIHHLLPSFDVDSPESCERLSTKLDGQAKETRKEIAELKSKIQALRESAKQMAEFWNSDDANVQLEQAFLRGSRLVILLGDIAEQMARPDGWTLINIAGQLIKQHAPEEVAALKERYGHKSLKGLIQATGIFDVFEESTKKGGTRVPFRLKPGWELSHT